MQGNKQLKFVYYLSLQRIKSVYSESGTIKETRMYFGDYEIQKRGKTTPDPFVQAPNSLQSYNRDSYFSKGGIKVDKEGYAYVIYQKGYSTYFEANGQGYMPTMIKAGKAYVNLPETRNFRPVPSKANDLYKNTETLVDDVFFLTNDIVKTVMSNNTLSIANKYGLKTVDVRLPITGAIEMNKNKFLSFTGKLKNVGTVSTALAYGGILYDIYDNKQITEGNVYQGIVTTAALWPGYGWMVAAGALALDAISYSYNGKSFASNLNERLNGGVLYKHKSNKE